MQSAGVERLCVLRSDKDNFAVPRGKTVTVACPVDCGPLEERTPVLFEPAQEAAWLDELELSEQFLLLPRVLPYLLVYKSTFYDQKISPKNRSRLIHKSYTKT